LRLLLQTLSHGQPGSMTRVVAPTRLNQLRTALAASPGRPSVRLAAVRTTPVAKLKRGGG